MSRILAPLALLLATLACSVEADDDDQTTMCTPGQVFACTCIDGSPGTSTCGFDSAPGLCMCSGTTDPTSGSDTTADPSTTMTTTEATDSCATDCADTTASAGSSESGGCSIYAGKVDSVSVPWTFMGQMGLMGGEAMCDSIGADHVCDFVEVVDAEQAGELDGLGAATIWIHRTTIESVEGVPSAPGPGGRCVDWIDATGTLADGEWAEVAADGIVFHLDPDTFYDGLDSSHTDPLAFPCMGVTRALLCCNAPC
jgi:hypothetical protein